MNECMSKCIGLYIYIYICIYILHFKKMKRDKSENYNLLLYN